MEVAWDPRKARSNLAKHRVSFEEAQTVFLDENARWIPDPYHSLDEERFVLLGFSSLARCVIVSHCYRESDLIIRLISARRATVREEQDLLELSMRPEYDFSKSRKNPYAKGLKKQITIRLDSSAVDYFKKLAAEMGIPYQNLINLYLRDCAARKARPAMQWVEAAAIAKPRTKQID